MVWSNWVYSCLGGERDDLIEMNDCIDNGVDTKRDMETHNVHVYDNKDDLLS